jgi:hypothetical protein
MSDTDNTEPNVPSDLEPNPLTSLQEANKNFIQKAIKKPGQLHKDLGVPQDKPIPLDKLKAAAKRKDKVGQRARFALVLKGVSKKRSK